MTLPLLVDAHEDLAYNILSFGRDYSRPAAETRRLEKDNDALAVKVTGETLLGWPDYQQGRVAIIFGTLFATPARSRLGEWDIQSYTTSEEAHSVYWMQLDVYHELVDRYPDKFHLVGTVNDLHETLWEWNRGKDPSSVGLVPLMEGAEGVREPKELEDWWGRGLRIIGLAWGGTRFCGGTRQPGPLTDEGKVLLDGMGEFPFTLDISHMDGLAALQALDRYQGPVIASHSNPAALLPGYTGNRHLTNDVIHSLVEHGGVMGIIPYCNFLQTDWKADAQHTRLPLERVVEHIDYVCQLIGNAQHVGIGTDFDGGFGLASVPLEVNTIADLQKLPPILSAHGYSLNDIDLIMGGNWLNHLEKYLPQ